MPLSTIFQLYRGSQFYLVVETGVLREILTYSRHAIAEKLLS
jgi:hypothetical protein